MVPLNPRDSVIIENNLERRGPFLLPFSGRDSESKRGETSRDGGTVETVL